MDKLPNEIKNIVNLYVGFVPKNKKEAQEVANLAVYLASDASAFTTGQFHIIDGGICM